MDINENIPWAKVPPRVRSAVLREMHNELARHFVAMEMAARISRGSVAEGDDPARAPSFADRIALHTAEMIVGYQAAIGELLGGVPREGSEEV